MLPSEDLCKSGIPQGPIIFQAQNNRSGISQGPRFSTTEHWCLPEALQIDSIYTYRQGEPSVLCRPKPGTKCSFPWNPSYCWTTQMASGYCHTCQNPFPLLAPNSAPKQYQEKFQDDRRTWIAGVFSHCRSVTRVINKIPFTEIDSLKQNNMSVNIQNLLADGNSGATPKRLSVIKEKQKKPKNFTRGKRS